MVSSNRTRIAWMVLGSLWLLMAGTVLGLWLAPRALGDIPPAKAEVLRQVFREVEQHYVFETDPDALMDGALHGMLLSLDDPYSAYVSPSELARFEESTTGQYHGIGIVMAPEAVPLTVLYPFRGGPAEDAGLQVGDTILAIDGEDVTQFAADEIQRAAQDRLLAPEGAPPVTLRVGRGEQELVVDVARGPVQRPSVKWARLVGTEPNTAYVYLSSFQNNTAAELRRALAGLAEEAGGTLAGLVVDLRDNTGGLLDECVAICRMFLQDGVILSTRGRNGVELSTLRADGSAEYADVALVLLVNADSASASEVMAGALRDHDRARLVGVRTFGKGVVQTVYRWDERDFRLRLTTAHYYTPNGTNIEKKLRHPGDPGQGGIAPDTVVELDKELGGRISNALARYEPPLRYRAAASALADRLGSPLQLPLGPDEDPQLKEALSTLRARMETGGTTANRPGTPPTKERQG